MPVHLILLVVSFVLLVLAGIIEWPRASSPAAGYGHPLGWLGLAAFVASFMVS